MLGVQLIQGMIIIYSGNGIPWIDGCNPKCFVITMFYQIYYLRATITPGKCCGNKNLASMLFGIVNISANSTFIITGSAKSNSQLALQDSIGNFNIIMLTH